MLKLAKYENTHQKIFVWCMAKELDARILISQSHTTNRFEEPACPGSLAVSRKDGSRNSIERLEVLDKNYMDCSRRTLAP